METLRSRESQNLQSFTPPPDIVSGSTDTTDPGFMQPCHLFLDHLEEQGRQLDALLASMEETVRQLMDCRRGQRLAADFEPQILAVKAMRLMAGGKYFSGVKLRGGTD